METITRRSLIHLRRIQSHNTLHEGSVKVMYEKPHEGHFLASVLIYYDGIVAGAAQAVGCHHHRQVARVHLCGSHNVALSEVLQESGNKNK